MAGDSLGFKIYKNQKATVIGLIDKSTVEVKIDSREFSREFLVDIKYIDLDQFQIDLDDILKE